MMAYSLIARRGNIGIIPHIQVKAHWHAVLSDFDLLMCNASVRARNGLEKQ